MNMNNALKIGELKCFLCCRYSILACLSIVSFDWSSRSSRSSHFIFGVEHFIIYFFLFFPNLFFLCLPMLLQEFNGFFFGKFNFLFYFCLLHSRPFRWWKICWCKTQKIATKIWMRDNDDDEFYVFRNETWE